MCEDPEILVVILGGKPVPVVADDADREDEVLQCFGVRPVNDLPEEFRVIPCAQRPLS